jgi:uncharacterized iron-regulated membrane protein
MSTNLQWLTEAKALMDTVKSAYPDRFVRQVRQLDDGGVKILFADLPRFTNKQVVRLTAEEVGEL